MTKQEMIYKALEENRLKQDKADEARDNLREMIENLSIDNVIVVEAFVKNTFFKEGFEPYEGDLCASYRNAIREQIGYCDDIKFMDFVWQLCKKSLPQDADTAEHHKISLA